MFHSKSKHEFTMYDFDTINFKKNVSQQYGSFEDHSITVPVEHGKNI